MGKLIILSIVFIFGAGLLMALATVYGLGKEEMDLLKSGIGLAVVPFFVAYLVLMIEAYKKPSESTNN